MNRALTIAMVSALAFVTALFLAGAALREGLMVDDTMRLWAGASSAGAGDLPFGRVVAAYPTIPFLSTTLVALLAPGNTPAPVIVAATIFALIVGFWFTRFQGAGMPNWTAAMATSLIAFHPMMLRAIVGGPADILFAVFLFMLAAALFDLRKRSMAPEVMLVGLTLFGLAFSHPMGAAIAFGIVPLLVFAVRPALVANSSFNMLVGLLFPTLFGLFAFVYVSWIFPGAGWSYFATPAESLSTWAVGLVHLVGDHLTGGLAADASLATGAAVLLGAPIALVALGRVAHRRPLIAPALVIGIAVIIAAASTVATGLFGDPSALAVAAPVFAAVTLVRVPIESERRGFVIPMLIAGWFGGVLSLGLVDPATAMRVSALIEGRGPDVERTDTLAAGGAMVGKEGVLVDIQNAPAIVVGRGGARGLSSPASEPFVLALLLTRLDAPYVAVPDPQSLIGLGDRLNRSFPTLFREGAPGFRVVYQNSTWRLFERDRIEQVKD